MSGICYRAVRLHCHVKTHIELFRPQFRPDLGSLSMNCNHPNILPSSDFRSPQVNFMSSFNSSSFPDSLALSKEASMSIGSIDEIQKLHIRTVPLGEQPRRLAHQEPSRSFVSPHQPLPRAPQVLLRFKGSGCRIARSRLSHLPVPPPPAGSSQVCPGLRVGF